MKFFKILIGLLLSSMLFTGCVGAAVSLGSAAVGTTLMSSNVKNTQTGVSVQNVKNSKAATIILYRIDRGGMTAVLNVKANGVNQGMLPTNAYILVQETKAKNVDILVTSNTKMKSSTISIPVQKGKVYYIDVDTISLVGVGVIKTKLVEENDVPKRFKLENLN